VRRFSIRPPSAAINEQFDTGDETGIIGHQKKRGFSNFMGIPHASHGDGGYERT
jgi:hypothetical protein